MNRDWELVEEKKLYAPALLEYGGRNIVNYKISEELFSDLEEIKSYYNLATKIIWPAPLPNKDGYYEL